MSWASGRKTTRREDEAYCLLGIFSVNMALLYGEGKAAFTRLQEVVLQAVPDLSIFAWADDDDSKSGRREYSGFLADSPGQFRTCSQIYTDKEDSIYRDPEFSARGIRMNASLMHLYRDRNHHQPVLNLLCAEGDLSIGVYLRKIGGGRYARWNPGRTVRFEAVNQSRRRQPAPVRYGKTMPTPPQRLHRATALAVENLIFPQKLEPSFEFHPTNPVLGHRRTALQMVFDVGDSELKLYRLSPMPRGHWDRHDQVFFCTNSINKSWCAAFAEWKLGNGNIFTFLVACFFWNHARETVTFIGVVDGLAEHNVSSLKHGLGQVKFEDTREAEDLICGALGRDRLHYEPRVVVDGGCMEAEVAWRVRQDVRPDICVNPMTLLDVSIGLTFRQLDGHVEGSSL